MMTTKELRELIGAGKTRKVIEHLKTIPNLDSDVQQSIVLLASRFAEQQRQKNLGTVSNQESSIELNQINLSLLNVIDEIGDKELTTNMPEPENTSNSKDTKKSFLTFDNFKSTIAVLAGIAGILTFYFKFCSNKPENGTSNNPKTVVVYTHGEGGKQDIIQFKSTHLIADINGRRDIAEIKENGQNIFTEVTSDSISIGIEGSEGFVLKNTKNTYAVNDKPIYVAVTMSETSKLLHGVIKDDKGELLEGVEIATVGEVALSEKTGYFKLKIPNEKQQNTYTLTLRKKGYTTATETYIPQSQMPEYRLKKVK
jgi:Effector-associated domain 11